MTAEDARDHAAHILAPHLASLTAGQAADLNLNIAGALLHAYVLGVDTLTLGGTNLITMEQEI